MTRFYGVPTRPGSGEVDLRPEPAPTGRLLMSRKHTCGHWYPDTSTTCGQDALLYPSGAYCEPHSPATMSGHPIPIPNPEWTAAAFRARARTRPDPLDNLPDTCPHDEPKGPRYCALCRRNARKAHP
jgi:hypothetical protein